MVTDSIERECTDSSAKARTQSKTAPKPPYPSWSFRPVPAHVKRGLWPPCLVSRGAIRRASARAVEASEHAPPASTRLACSKPDWEREQVALRARINPERFLSCAVHRVTFIIILSIHFFFKKRDDSKLAATEQNYLMSATTAAQPLADENQVLLQRAERGGSSGSSFGRQFFATVKRQVIQKRRMPCSMCLEIFLPILFIAGLVLASKAANITINPARQFVDPASGAINQQAFAKNLVCYNGTDPDLASYFQSCSAGRIWVGTSPDKEPTVPANFFADLLYYYEVVSNFDDWKATWGMLSIDDLVGVQWAVRILRGGPTSSVFAFGTLLTLRNSGRVFLIPNNTQTRSLSAYFGQKYVTWKYIHNEATDYYNSREEATNYLITVAGEGKAWALVELNDEQNKTSSFPTLDYRVSMNLSSVVDTTQIRQRFSGGLGGQPYRAYYVSGFLSLQTAISEYYLTQILGATSTDLPESTSAAPMGYAQYKNSTFLTIAGNLCPLVLVLAFLYSVSQLAKRIVEEKEARLREGTMIMGLGKTAFFCSWIFTYFIQIFFTTLMITLVLKAGIITESDPTVIFALYFMFGMSTISLSTLLSSFFSKSRVTAMAVPFLYFLISIPSFALPDGTSAGTYQMLSIFSPTAFSLGAKLLFQYEIGTGMGWNDVTSSLDTVNMATVLSMLVFDTILYMLLTLYLDEVLPSEWGTKKHPCFCCLLPCFSKSSAADDDYLESINETSPKLKMKPSHGRHDAVEDYPNIGKPCTVHIRNLRKEFQNEQGGVKVAVDNFDLQLFDDQVTVLLGHNGAGKTTTMNMLTGMLEMTQGDCVVYGKSVKTNLRSARGEIGFCPQHNILWPSLTCMEHLLYFAALKGLSGDAARDQALLMLKKVDLLDKKDIFSKNLSGGQKRKLSVAIAFIGGSRLILLDEPTAGMDVAARRHTWDLLREMSAGRTIVLTTHYMDEADLLGNRVAIMSKGALHSYGSPMFLKARLGTGYVMRLSFERAVGDPTPIVKRVQEKIPGASLKEHKGQEVAISLPIEAVGEFAHCIKYMEAPDLQKQLGMSGISMSVSTLEDVFVRIALEEEAEDAPPSPAPVTPPHSAAAATTAAQNNDHQYQALDVCYETKASTNPSIARQLFGLLKKRWCNTKRDRRTIVIQVFLPLGSIILAMLLTLLKAPDFHSLTLDLGMYGSVKQEVAFANCDTLPEFFSRQYTSVDALNNYPGFNQSYNFSMHLLDTFKTHGDLERFVGASCNDASQNWNSPTTTSTTVLFTNSSALHSLPQILNELYNAIARRVSGNNATLLRVATYPLPFTDRQSTTFNSLTTLIVGFFILIPFTFIPSTYVSWVVKERECKAKHLQFVSGVNFIIYWVSNFIFDLVSFLFTECLAIVVFAIFGRGEYVDSENIPVTILLFLLYGISAIAAAYCISFLFDNHSSAQTIVMLGNFLCGFVLVITMYILKQIDSTKSVAEVLVYIFRFVPAYCLGEGILALASAPSFRTLNKTINVFDMDQAGWGMTYMALETVIFSILTILLDHPSRQLRKQQLLFNEYDRPPAIENEDEDVKKERAEIETNEASRSGDVVRVTQLRKVYPASGKSGEKLAVKNLTFGVKKGEVFGFLGTNGAGKTTTMSVLTGEFLPTMGHCSVGGFDVVKQSEQAKQVIGYCPQFDALLDLLTPEEHLYLYAALRDIPLDVTDAVVNNLLASCALDSYRKVPSKSLSGGNKRKLSVAISLMGGPKIVFLDEPSAGMDPHARRQLWDVIIYVAKHSVVLTTHHLEEVDVLAHRVGIMVDGEMKCLGSLDHLKRKFGGGFEITIKASNEGTVQLVEKLMSEQFKSAKLVEERQQRMTYSLPFERTKMSFVFDVLQKAKQSGKFGIADYTVQQTSLEQVFLRISNNEIMSRKSQLPGIPSAEGEDENIEEEEDLLGQRAHSSFFLHDDTNSNDAREVAVTQGDVEMKTEAPLKPDQ